MASVYSDISTLDDEFPEITQEQQTFLSRAFTSLTSLLGSYVNHRWYVNFTNVLYNGHAVQISHKAKLPKLTITYIGQWINLKKELIIQLQLLKCS